MEHQVNPLLVQAFLDSIDYPASKEEILAAAREEGAGDALLAALEAIPEQEYDAPTAVSREIGR